MNIGNQSKLIRSCIRVSEEKFDRGDYDGSLELLCTAYAKIRELLQKVYAVKIATSPIERINLAIKDEEKNG